MIFCSAGFLTGGGAACAGGRVDLVAAGSSIETTSSLIRRKLSSEPSFTLCRTRSVLDCDTTTITSVPPSAVVIRRFGFWYSQRNASLPPPNIPMLAFNAPVPSSFRLSTIWVEMSPCSPFFQTPTREEGCLLQAANRKRAQRAQKRVQVFHGREGRSVSEKRRPT